MISALGLYRDTMWDFRISNIAGIQAADVAVEEGLNVVQASNFMGKSSFMWSIQTAMGTSGMYGESHPLTEGASAGSMPTRSPTKCAWSGRRPGQSPGTAHRS